MLLPPLDAMRSFLLLFNFIDCNEELLMLVCEAHPTMNNTRNHTAAVGGVFFFKDDVLLKRGVDKQIGEVDIVDSCWANAHL